MRIEDARDSAGGHHLPHPVKYVVVIAAVCVLLLDTFIHVLLGDPARLGLLPWTITAWLLWVVFAPVIVRIGTAVRYGRARWRFFLVHAAAALALTVAHTAVYVLLRTLVRGRPGAPGQPLADVLLQLMPFEVPLGLLAYGGTVLATNVSFFLQASRKREEERLALERWLAEAELDLYKLTLPVDVVNGRLLEIERTIAQDADRAEQLIEEFGAFLRESLAAASVRAEVDEIAFDEDELEDELPPALSMPLRLVLLFSISPAIHLVYGSIFAVSAAARGKPLPFDLLPYVVRGSILFFPATLLLVWLGSHLRRLTVLAAASATLPFLWIVGIIAALDGAAAARREFLEGSPPLDFLIFFGIALVSFTHTRYRKWRIAAVTVAQLESRVLRTRAMMLRLQLNPHFLFNALNSVAALLEDDTAAATKMTAQLRHFVARTLESSHREEVRLAEELESLADYVAIENVRFDGRVELDIQAGDEARRALVPSFLLQPLVENALRHGLMPETGGRVSVRATVRDGSLSIEVDDDGRSNGVAPPAREGLGLSNTRARLTQMYGDEFVLHTTAHGRGFRVTLLMPYASAR